jgi:NAD(P)-dependent dehydrogenase (short-subunit alcohol dehydrogenase family)
VIAIRGYSSRLSQAVVSILPKGERVTPVERGAHQTTADRHLFCNGLLRSEKIGNQTPEQIAEGFIANAARIIAECDLIIGVNDTARICVIGSESGFTGSFDGTYAASKAALHRYVETKKLRTADQQLICIAPGVIGDAGMTIRRKDRQRLEMREAYHPKRRFLTCAEVARWVTFCLYEDSGYMTNQVLRLNGGEHLK